MAAYTERIAIYKQREEINKIMMEMFSLLKEYTKGKAPDKVLVREEVVEQSEVLDSREDEGEDEDEIDKSTRWGKYTDRLMNMPKSRSIGYYLKHEINRKTIENLVNNHEYNDALLLTRLEKMDNEIYKSLPVGPMYDAILKKQLVKKKRKRR
ncbi:hypothetical protein Tco_0847816 [Tanacetum coccineum]